MTSGQIHRCLTISAAVLLSAFAMASRATAGGDPVARHPLVGTEFSPTDVDREHPVYRTSFDSADVVKDWKLEGGKKASVSQGNLVLESEPREGNAPTDRNHLVFWLKKEVPADFFLEFSVRPQNKQEGLNIVFFNTRGVNGENIFNPAIKPRNGVFNQYIKGDLNNYHVSYWAGGRGFANMRKNRGFHLVTSGIDYIFADKQNTFQTVQVYKRGSQVRVMVDGKVAIAFDDDGKKYGPVHTHSGCFGLRQMGHTLRCEYEYVRIYPLTAATR